MSKNKWAVVFGVLNGVLALLLTQLSDGTYPIDPVAAKALAGLVALAIAGITSLSPYFDWRQATK